MLVDSFCPVLRRERNKPNVGGKKDELELSTKTNQAGAPESKTFQRPEVTDTYLHMDGVHTEKAET